jgi:hypothetical protein
MFFKHPTNGSYKRVPIIENDALPAGIKGGMFYVHATILGVLNIN